MAADREFDPMAEAERHADRSSRVRVLRIVAITDGQVCDELWQTKPASVQAGHGLKNQIILHDDHRHATDYRRRAPLWILLGLLMLGIGGGYFASEVTRHARRVAQADTQGIELSSFVLDPKEAGNGGFGFALLLLGLVPLVAGGLGMRGRPVRRARQSERKGASTPDHHPLFVYSDGHYSLDLPPGARGKLYLGKRTATVSQLRERFGQNSDGRLQIKLTRGAKGKLIFGQTHLLFQMSPPMLAERRAQFPSQYLDPMGHLLPERAEFLPRLLAAALMMPVFVALSLIEGKVTGPPSDRFLRAMEIPSALYEKTDPDSADDVAVEEEQVLAVKEEKEVEKVEDKKEEVVKDQPQSFSQQSVEKARGVGIARVLGTWGGPGEGTVLDVIQGTENNLGELFDAGMTQTVMSAGGDISAFVAGGKGISETGALVLGSGLVTDVTVGQEIGRTGKSEKKVRGRVKSSTADIFGDVDKKSVRATIRRRMSALQHCYEKALRTSPSLRGKMTITITISTVGRVTKVYVEEDSLGSAAVKTCTKAKIKGWRFPSEGAEEPAEATFSVVFSGAS